MTQQMCILQHRFIFAATNIIMELGKCRNGRLTKQTTFATVYVCILKTKEKKEEKKGQEEEGKEFVAANLI